MRLTICANDQQNAGKVTPVDDKLITNNRVDLLLELASQRVGWDSKDGKKLFLQKTGGELDILNGVLKEDDTIVVTKGEPLIRDTKDLSWFGWFPGWFGTTKVKVLSLADLKEAFAIKKYKHIVVVVGAGISVSAGIPDFRTPGVGLYSLLDKHSLPTMESIFDIEHLKKDPAPFCEALQSLIPLVEKAQPTSTHLFLRKLADMGCLHRIFTQNFDSLEEAAGISKEKIVQLHGSLKSAHCISCNTEYSMQQFKEHLFSDIPKCDICGSFVKPDITLFGEAVSSVPSEDFKQCDLLLVLGTSLRVYPANALVQYVENTVPRVLINMEDVTGNWNLKLLGDCDAICNDLLLSLAKQ